MHLFKSSIESSRWLPIPIGVIIPCLLYRYLLLRKLVASRAGDLIDHMNETLMISLSLITEKTFKGETSNWRS